MVQWVKHPVLSLQPATWVAAQELPHAVGIEKERKGGKERGREGERKRGREEGRKGGTL